MIASRPFYGISPLFPVYPEPEDISPAQKYWILIQGTQVLFRNQLESKIIILQNSLPTDLVCNDPVYLGIKGDCMYHVCEVPVSARLPEGFESSSVRELYEKAQESDMAIASYAVRILEFHRLHAFCGRCGTKTLPLTTERAQTCPVCNTTVYPRISPAIIVLIKKGEEILLARSPRSPSGFYSVIAGFNEPGENLEQTVHREVKEEVGISVQNLRYFWSEPWPFPDSLMVGFVADYAGGEILVDNQEIEDAGWFTRENLPPYPSKASISRELIEAWISREI